MIDKAVAVILGGGVGSRLYPLTAKRSKPAVPIAGKYRLIDIPISNCINSDLKRMFILTMFNSASLNRHIKNTYHFDSFSDAFVNIMAAEQTPTNKNWFQGTADAVRQTKEELDKVDYEYVLILSGDQLYQMDFSQLLDYHIKQAADLTVATIPVIESDAVSFGIMKVDEKGVIESFIEKPNKDVVQNWKSPVEEQFSNEGKDYLASMGIYVFNRSVMDELFQTLPDANDFGKEIIPHAVLDEQRKVVSYPFAGYWTDIGNISSFFEANLKLTKFLPEYHLYDNVKKLYTHARFLAPAKIFNTIIDQALICDGVICHAKKISNALIGIRSRIGKDTVIQESIIMGNDYYQTLDDIEQLPNNELLGIGNNCHIQKTIIDKNARIGHNVHIIGGEGLEDIETENYCIKQGIVIVKKAAFIPDNSRIGLEAK